jgi:SAM-dependent methyltransferase
VGAYNEDLAYVHDAGFLAVAEAGAAALIEFLRRRGSASGLVVELGCGSGASSRRLTEAGYDVLGLDSSPSMIELARMRAPRAEFRVESFLGAELPACDAATAFGEVLNYLFDEQNSQRELGALFGRVYDALRAGGVFIFDLAVPGRGAGRGWTAGDDWAVLYETEEEQEEERSHLLTRRILTFREIGGAYRRREEVHRQRLFPAPVIAELLRRADFRVLIRRGYGQRTLAPNVRAFLATKPLTPSR